MRALCSPSGTVKAHPLPVCFCLPQVVNQMLERTSSGGFGGNDGFLYLTLPAMPLGGVGEFLALSIIQPQAQKVFAIPPECGPWASYGLGFPI